MPALASCAPILAFLVVVASAAPSPTSRRSLQEVSCELPAAPPETQFVPGVAQCEEGGIMPGDGSEPRLCDVECIAGTEPSQAPSSPFFSCNDAVLTPPALVCTGAGLGYCPAMLT
jgi:hypothetical protein